MKRKILVFVALVCALAVAPTELALAYTATIDLNYIDNNFSITTPIGHLIETYEIAPGHSVTETLYVHNSSNQTLDFAWIRFTETNGRTDANDFSITVSHNGEILAQRPLGFLVANSGDGDRLTQLAPNATTEYDVTLKLHESARNEYQLQQFYFDFQFAIQLDTADDSGGWTNLSIPLVPNTGAWFGAVAAGKAVDITVLVLCILAVGSLIFGFIKRRKGDSKSKSKEARCRKKNWSKTKK